MKILEQNQTIFKGTCKIIFEHLEIDSSFQIEYRPYAIAIKIPHVRMGQWFAFGYGTFEGISQENNISIKCSKIGLSAYSKNEIVFALVENLIIGIDVKAKKFKAKLIGAYFGNINFQFSNFIIEIKENPNFESIIEFCKTYGDTLEGSELIISEVNGNDLVKDDAIELSKNICLLLSFINATLVTYNRFQFISIDNEIQDVWRIRLVHHDRGTQCINLLDTEEVLRTILTTFYTLKPTEKKCLETVTGYLNSTSGKYLEDCILNIAQAWEIFADEFNVEKIQPSDEIKKLKSDIKLTIQKWKLENSISYDTAFISNRLLNSLNWEVAIKKIENLAIKENLNFEKLRLNFKKLIEIRNDIVHTGRFKVIGEEEAIADILDSSTLGLQISILSKLGYTGYILKRYGGVIGNAKINEFKHK